MDAGICATQLFAILNLNKDLSLEHPVEHEPVSSKRERAQESWFHCGSENIQYAHAQVNAE
jgi:hypothetical protein